MDATSPVRDDALAQDPGGARTARRGGLERQVRTMSGPSELGHEHGREGGLAGARYTAELDDHRVVPVVCRS